MRGQRGFTLLELMVAMVIFAALAVVGWQVFDSVNRARERAQLQADNLAVLQYAYLQLQQDMGQIIAYQAPSTDNTNTASLSADNANNANTPVAQPYMSLDSEQLSFMRFADPDPRYQTSPSVQRVEYLFSDERLTRRQYNSLDNDSIGLDTVLLDGVTLGRWQAYMPELVAQFPNAGQSNSGDNAFALAVANSINAELEVVMLPKGVSISFTYNELPITWVFALSPQSPPNNSKASTAGNKNSDADNGDSTNNNGNNSNDANANNNANSNPASNTTPKTIASTQ